ncbi:MAG: DUF2806 domain-containing protein [Oscillatoriophycideae cyanobacterium NC_groundwater_1537_Pr4_S-0.65um_50_18]|nr:DUF2806 domain-containing protein [Oscillatoriophycideae cyanobacterium NC_groundwater_1537_Pr4_S-0.65um_50_18]
MSEEQTTEALSTVTNVVKELVSDGGLTLPTPIRRNALKAFDQLCTALMDLPVAYLEGKAAERRAATQARIKLITTSADQIAAQMSVDPQYARIAADKYGQRIVQEQINLDKICEVAAQEIYSAAEQNENSGKEDEEALQISDDWIDSFRKEACGKSSEEMQILFGKILAGEIKQPDSFSIRTVRIMGQLDSRAASLFRLLCSLCVTLGHQDVILDSRVPSLGGNAAQNFLQHYGLSFANLNVLEEYGLIISDFNSYIDYRATIARNNMVGVALKYSNTYWGLVPANIDDWPLEKDLRVHGVQLSNSGKELLKIVEIEPNEQYASALNAYFLNMGLKLTVVPNFQ